MAAAAPSEGRGELGERGRRSEILPCPQVEGGGAKKAKRAKMIIRTTKRERRI